MKARMSILAFAITVKRVFATIPWFMPLHRIIIDTKKEKLHNYLL